MVIEWSIVATIAAPLVALFVGAALNRAIESRARLVSYLGHVSAHRINLETENHLDVFTHSIVLKNNGRSPAHNVRITHTILPSFNVHPGVVFTRETLPSGEVDIVIPVLVPHQEITISYLYHPPTTWNQINGHIKSDEGMAKVLTVLPMIQYPKWANAIVGSLMFVGLMALLYVIAHLAI